jgi:nucleotide-binding universal stress UspA family protein
VKVLVAVDDSEVSRKAVAFAGKLLGPRTISDCDVTLFHVCESLPEFILARTAAGEENSAFRQVAAEWARTGRTLGEKLLEEQALTLVAAGIPPEKVNVRLCQKESRPESRRVVAALAIIEEMKQGGYDLVVIGRRGTSASIESFLGGVAEKIAREARGCSVCIVD